MPLHNYISVCRTRKHFCLLQGQWSTTVFASSIPEVMGHCWFTHLYKLPLFCSSSSILSLLPAILWSQSHFNWLLYLFNIVWFSLYNRIHVSSLQRKSITKLVILVSINSAICQNSTLFAVVHATAVLQIYIPVLCLVLDDRAKSDYCCLTMSWSINI